MDGRTAPAARPGEWIVPASYAQERVWFASQIARDEPVYTLVDEFRLPYPLPSDRIRAALLILAARHETLRTSFRAEGGGLWQVVHAEVEPELTEVDLAAEPEPARQARIAALLREAVLADIRLDRAPLWRATLVRVDAGGWLVLFAASHAVVDAGSQLILRAEIAELCAAETSGREPRLAELPIQYADYAVWQRDWLSGGRMDELLGFWRSTLADLPAVHGIPLDRLRPTERRFAGADLVVPLPDGSADAAVALARRAGATPVMVLLAAYAALVHALSGRIDVVIGLPVAGRDRSELGPVVGMFVNLVVVRVDVSGDPTFAELLDRVRSTLLAAWDHQDMPFQKLVEALAPAREPGVPPLYQLGFNHLTVGFSRRGVVSTEDDLMLEICGGEARLEYDTALFDEATVAGIAEGYRRVLAAVLARPQTRMSALGVRPARAGALVSGPEREPEREPVGSAAATGHVPPRTAAEELVAAVWAEVLGRDVVGATDDFFDLGGHSLLALRVIARLSAAAEVAVGIREFFADPTVAGVAAEVERVLAAELDELGEEEAERLAAGDEGRGT